MTRETVFHLDVLLTIAFAAAAFCLTPWCLVPAALCAVEAVAIGRKLS